METTRKSSTSQMSSVLRTFEILEAVAQRQPISLSELVKSFKYSKSTVQRTLTTLQAAGWLKQVSESDPNWEVTSRSLLVKPRALEGGSFYNKAKGPMTVLRDKTNETIHLSIMDRSSGMILIDRVDCNQVVRTFSPIGDTSPIHATSIGRAVLAFLPSDEINAILDQPLSKYTDKTLATKSEILENLELIRQRGYSVNDGEYRSMVCAIAAPIFNEIGEPIAGICISIPESRFDPNKTEQWGSWVAEAAAQISAS